MRRFQLTSYCLAPVRTPSWKCPPSLGRCDSILLVSPPFLWLLLSDSTCLRLVVFPGFSGKPTVPRPHPVRPSPRTAPVWGPGSCPRPPRPRAELGTLLRHLLLPFPVTPHQPLHQPHQSKLPTRTLPEPPTVSPPLPLPGSGNANRSSSRLPSGHSLA